MNADFDVIEVGIQDVRAALKEAVDTARRGTPMVVTRHGKPQCVILGYTPAAFDTGITALERHSRYRSGFMPKVSE